MILDSFKIQNIFKPRTEPFSGKQQPFWLLALLETSQFRIAFLSHLALSLDTAHKTHPTATAVSTYLTLFIYSSALGCRPSWRSRGPLLQGRGGGEMDVAFLYFMDGPGVYFGDEG